MPAKSSKQQKFMAICAHTPGKAQGKCPPKDVAQEFSHKPKGGFPHSPGNPVKKGTTHHAAKDLGIPAGPKNKGTTKAPYSSKGVAHSIMRNLHRPRGG